MEQTIEILCEKFGVTVDGLVNELFRYHTTMDKIGIVAWGIITTLSILSFLVLRDKFKQWWQLESPCILWIIVPVVFIVISLIIIPYMIYDLVCWHVSPFGAMLDSIM